MLPIGSRWARPAIVDRQRRRRREMQPAGESLRDPRAGRSARTPSERARHQVHAV